MNLSPHKQDKISKRLFLENLFVLLKVIFLKIKHRPPFSPQVPPPPPQVPQTCLQLIPALIPRSKKFLCAQ